MNQSDIPNSPSVTNAILDGKVVISEECPRCGSYWAYPTGEALTCGDCYTEFNRS